MSRKFAPTAGALGHTAVVVAVLAVLISLAPLAQATDISFSRIDFANSFSFGAVPADFNGDDKLDLVACTYDSQAHAYGIDLALGNGDGTFSSPSRVFTDFCVALAAADLNADGKSDLIMDSGEELWVFLGNGNGTFDTNPRRSPAPASGRALLVDLNRDGKVDIALVAQGGGIAVAMGKGDGTFGSFTNFPITGGSEAIQVIAADFNGDGKPDLAATNRGPAPNFQGTTVSVLLGNGDGTFGPPTDFSVGTYPMSLVATDLNNDSRLDLAVSNFQAASVSILLGNGDGTFLSSTTVPVLPFPGQIAAADFNGNGKIDLAVADGRLSILPGLGDGTFGPRVDFADVVVSQALAVGDFNLDQKPDVLISANDVLSIFVNTHPPVASQTKVTTSSSPSLVGQPVTFTVSVTSPSWMIPNGELVTFYDGMTVLASLPLESGTAEYTTSSLAPRTHTIKASYPGDITFTPSKGSVKQVVQKYATTATLTAAPNPSNFGQAVTFTAQVTSAGPLPTGRVKFLDGTVRIGVAMLSAGTAKFTRSTLAVGDHPITAQYLGDLASGKSTSPVVNQVVNP